MIIILITLIIIICIIFVKLKQNNNSHQLPIKYGNGDFDITLVNTTRVSRSQVVKLLCNYLEISQEESECIIENLPYTFMRNIDESYAERLKESLEYTGAKVEIKKSQKKN